MKILSIETSCDETAISLMECGGDLNSPNFSVLGNMIASQAELHAQYGGVFPAMAKREHAKNIWPVCEKVLKEAELFNTQTNSSISEDKQHQLKEILAREENLYEIFLNEIAQLEKPDIDYIGVTTGPGLEPALWVGISFAKALGILWDIPVLPVNHMEGHILSVLLAPDAREVTFPALSLLISGGHTELVLIKSWGDYTKIGHTLDDAIGEAFDKVARILGLPYPGGPHISRLAKIHREQFPQFEPVKKLPRPMIHTKDFDFSFSGIKTAVLYTVEGQKQQPGMTHEFVLDETTKQAIARDFEDAVTEVLVHKTMGAMKEYGCETLIVGGGVSANTYIKAVLTKKVLELNENAKVYFPEQDLSTDNSLMIGIATYFTILKQKTATSEQEINLVARGGWSL